MKDNIKKIIEFGIYFLIFILPLQTRWIIRAGEFNGGYTEYSTYSLYGFDILLLALIILQGLSYFKNKPAKIIKTPLLWALLGIFEFICFVSIFFALDTGLAIFVYARFLLALGLFWLMVRSEFDKYKIIIVLVLTASLQALLAIWQFVSQSSFASKWLGMSIHDPAKLGVSVVETVGPEGHMERWLRAYGSLDHPNMLGGFLALALVAIIFFGIKKVRHKKANLFLVTVMPVLTLGLVFSFSRAAWIGIIFGIILMTVAAVKRRALYAQKIIAESIFIVSVIFFIAYLIYPNLFVTRISVNTRLENISSRERIMSIDVAQKIGDKYSGIGTGIGNYTQALQKIDNLKYSYQLQPVHNTFLLIKSEVGIFGILMFLMILMYYFQIIIKSKKNIYLIGGLLVVLSVFMFDHWLWSLHFGLMLLALMSGGVVRLIYGKES